VPPSLPRNHHAEDSDECTAAATHMYVSASNGSRDNSQRASSHYYRCWCKASAGVSAGGPPLLLVLVFLVAFMLSAEVITMYGYI